MKCSSLTSILPFVACIPFGNISVGWVNNYIFGWSDKTIARVYESEFSVSVSDFSIYFVACDAFETCSFFSAGANE
jgi:hypothetical protein